MNVFISPQYRRHSKLILLTFFLAFVVILLGAYTRLTDAGLSCPDWPNCYGYITAPHTESQIQDAVNRFPGATVNVKKAWTEMTHRYLAAIEGILILILAGRILFSRKLKNWQQYVVGSLLLCLLGLQVALGRLTVTANLKPVIVLAHLMTGLTLLSVLWWAYLILPLRPGFVHKIKARSLKPWIWIAFIIVSLQIALGGWVSSHYAGLACTGFPTCNGFWLPDIQFHLWNSDLLTIHMLHRIGAVVTAIYLSGLSVVLLRKNEFRILGGILLFLIGLQVSLGILNVLWLRPIWVALFHHGIAAIILLVIITTIAKASLVSDDQYALLP